MIALWMLAATLIAALLGGAALAAEHVARLWRRPARDVWTVALLAATLLPLVPAALPRVMPRATTAAAAPAAQRGDVLVLPTIVVRAGDAARDRAAALARLDRPLAIAWLTLSTLVLFAVARGALGLARARRAWRTQYVDGTPVLVAEEVGPAVVGVRRPAIVLPEWALALDAPLRALVVRHESEHVRAGDPRHLALGALAVTLMPWNATLWWLLRRQRSALEIDCDARVLAAHHDVPRYGLLLLAVAQRRATTLGTLAGAPALAESTSDLGRRITAMRTQPPQRRLARTLLGAAAATLAVAAAAGACSASRDIVSPRATPRKAAILTDTNAARRDSLVLVPMKGARSDVRTVTIAKPRMDSVQAMVPEGDGTLRARMMAVDSATSARAASAGVAPRPALPMTVPAGQPYFEFQVEQPVRPLPGNTGPRYPAELRAAQVEGTVLAQFVVDTLGNFEPASFKVLRSDHALFTQTVRDALVGIAFEPARVGGRKVRQLVQQPFQFQLSR